MDFIHYDFNLLPGQMLEIYLDQQANVKLMTDLDFYNYQSGLPHNYYGGVNRLKRTLISAPHAGHWHLTIDLAGNFGTIRHAVRILN